MAEASLFPLVEILFDDSYGLSYRNHNKPIMQRKWWSFHQNRKRGCQWEMGKNSPSHGSSAGTPIWKGSKEHKTWKYWSWRIQNGGDETDAQMILICLKNWTPTMQHSDQPISNIATGKIATEAMSKNTLSLKKSVTDTL